MLEIVTGTKGAPVTWKVALDECCGSAMLTLDDGEGHVFRQALDAHDVGKALAVCGEHLIGAPVCEGDLRLMRVSEGLGMTWPRDGGDSGVFLKYPDMLVFQEALKGWCRMLMRSKPGEAL